MGIEVELNHQQDKNQQSMVEDDDKWSEDIKKKIHNKVKEKLHECMLVHDRSINLMDGDHLVSVGER
eukprot:15333206-Ditylum_brightwellii.AAC.1